MPREPVTPPSTAQMPPHSEALRSAIAAYDAGDRARAERLCRSILANDADQPEALNLLGIILSEAQHLEEAAALFARLVALQPGSATAHNNYGNVLTDLQRIREAIEQYDRALELQPRYAEAYCNRAGAERAAGQFEAALASYDRAISVAPGNVEAHYSRGVTLQERGRFEEAVASYARALALSPGLVAAHYNSGIALQRLGRLHEALNSYERALQIAASAEVYINRGNVLLELGRGEEALLSYEQARGLNPARADVYNNRGNALRLLKRPEEALASYARALELDPAVDWLRGAWLHVKLELCDWADLESACQETAALILRGRKATKPFTTLAISDSASVQLRAAQIASAEYELISRAATLTLRYPARKRIHVGYYSADFHNHATAQLLSAVFEHHDRGRFEVSGFAFGPDRTDDMTLRLGRAFDRFVDVRSTSVREVAQLSRELAVDIAVDLKGFTQDSRPGIFAHRAAPLQVSYLGYPGTSGAEYMDYIVADATVIPPHARQHFSEKVIYLPHTYQANSYRFNDQYSPGEGGEPGRVELGLPATGFVFCCFNNTYKITPAVFQVWMRILAAVADSVLWLLSSEQTVVRNLRREAERLGIDGARLIFARPLPLAQHLPRQLAADLFLDTFPYGAHTTASDALWMGLPLVTRPGETMASRVAASLLAAVGLPELVGATAEQYEALAIGLGRDRQRLAATRRVLAANRLTMPLFDTALTTRHLESAYAEIHRRYQAGLGPEDIAVPRGAPDQA